VVDADDLIPYAIYAEHYGNQFICLYNEKPRQLQEAKGASPYNIGDEVELELICQATKEI